MEKEPREEETREEIKRGAIYGETPLIISGIIGAISGIGYGIFVIAKWLLTKKHKKPYDEKDMFI